MVNTTYNSREDMIIKLQSLKSKTKSKFYKKKTKNYDEMNVRFFKFKEDTFSKNAQGIGKLYHEVMLLMKFLQTRPQVKKMNIKFYALYYNVIKNRDDKYEDIENDYININDFITPNHYVGLKPRETILK